MKLWSFLRYPILGFSLKVLLAEIEAHRSFLTCLFRVMALNSARSLNFLLSLFFQRSPVGLCWVPCDRWISLRGNLVRWLWVFYLLLFADILNNVVEVILFKHFVLLLQLFDLTRDFLCGFRAQIWQLQLFIKLFIYTLVEFFHDLDDLLNAFWNSLLVELLSILISPIFEVSFIFTENNVNDQGFQLLIMGC